jgi:hypothetical protein
MGGKVIVGRTHLHTYCERGVLSERKV